MLFTLFYRNYSILHSSKLVDVLNIKNVFRLYCAFSCTNRFFITSGIFLHSSFRGMYFSVILVNVALNKDHI